MSCLSMPGPFSIVMMCSQSSIHPPIHPSGINYELWIQGKLRFSDGFHLWPAIKEEVQRPLIAPLPLAGVTVCRMQALATRKNRVSVISTAIMTDMASMFVVESRSCFWPRHLPWHTRRATRFWKKSRSSVGTCSIKSRKRNIKKVVEIDVVWLMVSKLKDLLFEHFCHWNRKPATS